MSASPQKADIGAKLLSRSPTLKPHFADCKTLL
jgi:hypothetical protein